MLLQRMAFRPFLCLTLSWTALLTAVAAAPTPTISSEILNFVPPCAQDCFRSFILSNFNFNTCGTSPSMQCLCRQAGNGGYTLGEGAVSCMVAESSFGVCKGTDAGTVLARNTAYNMCVNIESAAPKTHTVILATLIVPPGSAPLLVPTPTPTASSSTLGTKTASFTSSTATSEPSTLTPISTQPTTTQPLAAGATTAPAAAATTSSRPVLTSAQIAGIALGCAALVVFGIFLVCLARCVRRKRHDKQEPGFSKMRDSWNFGRKSHPDSPHLLQISNPLHNIPLDMQFQRPVQQTPTQRPALGLAISLHRPDSPARRQQQVPAYVPQQTLPPYETAYGQEQMPGYTPQMAAYAPPLKPTASPAQRAPQAQRGSPAMAFPPPPAPQSQLQPQTPKAGRSPPKPTLTLAIPGAPTLPSRITSNARESIVTEFAEDGEGDSASGAGAAIWRPPPSDPQSATAYYFADKGGNWVLRKTSARKPEAGKKLSPAVPEIAEVELPSPENKTRAERAREAYGGLSPGAVVSPLHLAPKPGQAKLGSPIVFKDKRHDPKVVSSVYSAGLPSAATASNSRNTKMPLPDTYFSMMKGRELTTSKAKRRSRRESHRRSRDSSTSIESGVAGPFEDDAINDDVLQADLSPVAESPSVGKSPVEYPKIPRRGNPEGLYMLSPPPRFPAATGPQGQPSPTLGGPVPVKQTGASQRPPPKISLTVPTLNPNPNRNPGQLKTGSPETRQGTIPAVQQHSQRQYQQRQKQQWEQQQQREQQQREQVLQQQRPRQRESRSLAEYWNQQPRQGQNWRPYPPANLPGDYPEQEQPGYYTPPQQQRRQPQSQARSPQQIAETGLPQSSLLAKRLGADKAATLKLAGKDATPKKAKTSWKRESYGPQGQGLGQPPSFMRPGYPQHSNGRDEVAQLPGTPGWMPKLTPTRRGDDLFLDVR
ncbi:hypothetical protein B0H63DRAFT_235040 [Podospora didyma]|uniref:Extracellular membrane protein CFEM domain-containing protein n=1 Tax=Podospora didyma TaxID=330526 RepID=A0AAE0KL21_9PEZI|nr:hypothetical protein B0H63DRAFT_235040 [Podospora didyma]